jgi:hypothetical protein
LQVNTALQFILLGTSLSHFAFELPLSVDTLVPLWYLTGTTTLLSGMQYLDGSGMKSIAPGQANSGSYKKFTWK